MCECSCRAIAAAVSAREKSGPRPQIRTPQISSRRVRMGCCGCAAAPLEEAERLLVKSRSADVDDSFRSFRSVHFRLGLERGGGALMPCGSSAWIELAQRQWVWLNNFEQSVFSVLYLCVH